MKNVIICKKLALLQGVGSKSYLSLSCRIQLRPRDVALATKFFFKKSNQNFEPGFEPSLLNERPFLKQSCFF